MDQFATTSHSKLYSDYRPTYSNIVIDTIINFCKKSGKNDFKTVVDVGCGTGQSSHLLAPYFENVIGIDVSASQIAQAKVKYPNIEFRTGPAEDLSFLEDASVSLITVAQAYHFLDKEVFLPEVQRSNGLIKESRLTIIGDENQRPFSSEEIRQDLAYIPIDLVLKTGGALVVYSYDYRPTVEDEIAQRYMSQFYRDVFEAYQYREAKYHMDNHYKEYVLPFKGWSRNNSIEMKYEWNVDKIIGYISSQAGYQDHLKRNPGSRKLDDLQNKLKDCCGDRTLITRWPIFMLMGHK